MIKGEISLVSPVKQTKLDVYAYLHTHNIQIVICTKLFSFKKIHAILTLN